MLPPLVVTPVSWPMTERDLRCRTRGLMGNFGHSLPLEPICRFGASFWRRLIVGFCGCRPQDDKAEPGRVRAMLAGDARRREHTRPRMARRKAVVLVFIDTECPVSNGYAPDMHRIADEICQARRGVLAGRALRTDSPTADAATQTCPAGRARFSDSARSDEQIARASLAHG